MGSKRVECHESFTAVLKKADNLALRNKVMSVLSGHDVAHFNRAVFLKLCNRYVSQPFDSRQADRLYQECVVSELSHYPLFAALPWMAPYALLESYTKQNPLPVLAADRRRTNYVLFKACKKQTLDYNGHEVTIPLQLLGHLSVRGEEIPMKFPKYVLPVSFQDAMTMVHYQTADPLMHLASLAAPFELSKIDKKSGKHVDVKGYPKPFKPEQLSLPGVRVLKPFYI